ncbi:MAG TPA: methyltransferase domain-containing protein [Bryobacteraceae bacterium]|jgi:SAM-dependent methyltransferase
MSSNALARPAEYTLATGAAAVRRLHVLHSVYSPVGRRVLLQAGLAKGMKVADFGCGVGVVSRMLAEIVGPSGSVTGVDINGDQLEQARQWCESAGLANTTFIEASADNTGLERGAFDLAYCRFLLLHLSDPAACLHEMRAILKPGGILVIEDGDLSSAGSIPPTALNASADLFVRLGRARGLDYTLGAKLYHLVASAGFCDAGLEIHQPAIRQGENRNLLKWSVEEAAPALIDAGLITPAQLQQTLAEMQEAIDNPGVVVLMPRMSLVWARKPNN